MKPTSPEKIRNVALISHGGAGKTSLAEAMLFDAGAISRLGTVEGGTTTLDWDPDEHRRTQSINLAIGSLEHDGVRITIVDTHVHTSQTREASPVKVTSVVCEDGRGLAG